MWSEDFIFFLQLRNKNEKEPLKGTSKLQLQRWKKWVSALFRFVAPGGLRTDERRPRRELSFERPEFIYSLLSDQFLLLQASRFKAKQASSSNKIANLLSSTSAHILSFRSQCRFYSLLSSLLQASGAKQNLKDVVEKYLQRTWRPSRSIQHCTQSYRFVVVVVVVFAFVQCNFHSPFL